MNTEQTVQDEPLNIRRKQHMHRITTIMPRFGVKNITYRDVPITLPHITFVDGPYQAECLQ